MTHGLPPAGGKPQIPGDWEPERREPPAPPAGAAVPPPPPAGYEPPPGYQPPPPPPPPAGYQPPPHERPMRGPLAPRPEGWEPPPRKTMDERDEAVRGRLGKIGGPVAVVGLLLWKVGRVLLLVLGKVALLFKIPLLGTVISGAVSIAAYAWIWGWTFAGAIMITLLVHELGHVVQIKREGMPVHALNFVPFLGAYVQSDAARTPDQQARISIAGPLAGTLLASAVYLTAGDDQLVLAIAYTGFYLNLLNLMPIGFLDGGGVAGVFTAGWWVIIAGALAAITLGSGSMLALLVGIMAAVRIYTDRDRGFALDPPGPIPLEQRVNAAVLFIGVCAVCAFGAAASFADRTSEIVRAPAAHEVTASLVPSTSAAGAGPVDSGH